MNSAPLRVFVFTTLALASACSYYPRSAPPPTSITAAYEEVARRSDASADQARLERGRSTFVSKCGECHDHPDLSAIALAEWPEILARMAGKAELEGASARELESFVLAAAEASGAPAR
ncbi:MAG: hypothetical protein IT384_02505 [Deltaproteobacteria bacterium]|nr:hypothetical protein [Deltaproteobacteria bacterium]